MAELNHYAISAGMGATLGPRVVVHHGQIGSSELAATLSALSQRRKRYVEVLNPSDTVTRKYEKAVIQAFKMVRDGYSSDRVLADPALDAKFIKACRDLGLDDSVFHLNLTLVGLRKHNKLKLGKSRRGGVSEQWRYAVASEIAARVVHYRRGVSVDTMLAHPVLVAEFDDLAKKITPGFSSFEYRWAALNLRKKGASVKVTERALNELAWQRNVKFHATAQLPNEEGVYSLFERETCLFVAGTEDIHESIESQRRIAEVPIFQPELWQPKPERLTWQYVRMPDTGSDYRFGVVRSLVGRWQPIFNIPRGKDRKAAA